MTQQTNGMQGLKTLGDVWEVMKKHGLEAKYCPHCDQFSQARVLLKQDQLISDLYEACNTFGTALKIWQQDPSKAPITLVTIFNETIGKALAKVEKQ